MGNEPRRGELLRQRRSSKLQSANRESQIERPEAGFGSSANQIRRSLGRTTGSCCVLGVSTEFAERWGTVY